MRGFIKVIGSIQFYFTSILLFSVWIICMDDMELGNQCWNNFVLMSSLSLGMDYICNEVIT